MEHSIKDLENGKKELTLIVTKEEIKPHYDKAYNEVRKSISIPGFRRGKVPNHIIKNMHGVQIEQDAAQEAGNEFFGKYLDDHSLELAGTPELHEIKFNDDGTVTYILAIELMPEIELKDYQGLTIDEPTYTVSEEDIAKQIETLCREYGTFEEVDTVEDDTYVISYSTTILDPDTREPLHPEDAPEDAQADLKNERTPQSLKDAVVGKNKGDFIEVWLPNTEDEDVDSLYKIEILSVDKPVPATFDDEFAKERTQGKFETAEDFKYDMQLQMQAHWDKQSRQMVENNIIEEMVKLHGDFDVPADVVERQAVLMVRNMFTQMTQREPAPEDIKPEFVTPYLPIAKRTLQWDLIRRAIVNKEELEVDDYDLEDFFEEQISQMGDMSGIDEEQRNMMFEQFKTNPGIKDSLMNKKVIDLIYDYAITNDVDFEGNPIEINTELNDTTEEEKEEKAE